MSEVNETSCGDCTVCCLALRIDEFGKQAGVMCQHCTGKGCGIYETRYDVCRGFLCGYRLLPKLGEAWRPDRSGVLVIVLGPPDIPEEYQTSGHGMHFIIVGGEKAVLRPGFADYVGTLVSRHVPVYLSADSPKTLINKYLEKLVAEKRKQAVLDMLLHLYRQHVEYRAMNKWRPLPWVELPETPAP
jgi:hypothetical protein